MAGSAGRDGPEPGAATDLDLVHRMVGIARDLSPHEVIRRLTITAAQTIACDGAVAFVASSAGTSCRAEWSPDHTSLDVEWGTFTRSKKVDAVTSSRQPRRW